MRFNYIQTVRAMKQGMSKNIRTLTRFLLLLLFFKQTTMFAHPTSHYCFYGNCQERVYIFCERCIPSSKTLPSVMYAPLGIYTQVV